jgi:uncharacterized protein (TIGR02266 family)
MSSAPDSATGKIDSVGKPRPVRVLFPVQVRFEGAAFSVDQFTANLGVGGIFLPTEQEIPIRTRGHLSFRLSQWDQQFTVEAEVVWRRPPDQETDEHEAGIGLMFIDLSAENKRRLQRLVDGIQDGSVTEAIRRSFHDSEKTLLHELRKRPTDQKVMFAIAAQSLEIDALIQEGSHAAILRLLSNPRLQIHHVRKILQDTRTQVAVLLEIHKERRWMHDNQIRVLFCQHPLAPLEKVFVTLPRLKPTELALVVNNKSLRKPVLDQAQQLMKSDSA